MLKKNKLSLCLPTGVRECLSLSYNILYQHSYFLSKQIGKCWYNLLDIIYRVFGRFG
jgi:hypothetical protein